jgi:site-specific DNA-methyltransferase (cytosine-N4-specific)
MPESVRDRLNCRHELIFLFVKQAAYWFDLNPIRIPHRTTRPPSSRPSAQRNTAPPGRRDSSRPPKYGPHAREIVAAQRYGTGRARRVHPNGRNPGDVWSVPTRPYAGPHFAAFPVELPLRCVAAGCKPGGTVLDMFAGSGTTGLAAAQLGRRFIGIELSTAFAALAAERVSEAARPEREGGPS